MSALRSPRVRFKHPIRVSALDGPPRVLRTLTGNLSLEGLFVRMPEPLAIGARVALSFEAQGQTLPFAEAEVVWCRHESKLPGRHPGFGVRFQRFLHPRAHEMVEYLVENLDRGKPLRLAPRPRRALRRAVWAVAALSGLAGAAVAAFMLRDSFDRSDDSASTLALAVHPIVTRAAEPPAAEGASPELVAAEPREAEKGNEIEQMADVADVIPPAEQAPTEPSLAKPAADEAVVQVAELPPAQGSERRGELVLPSGAAHAVTWAMADRELRVATDSAEHVTRVFWLDGPPRVVFDVEGAAPSKSHALAGLAPFIKQVRVGRQGASTTRVVIDLARAPTDVTEDGQAVIVSF